MISTKEEQKIPKGTPSLHKYTPKNIVKNYTLATNKKRINYLDDNI